MSAADFRQQLCRDICRRFADDGERRVTLCLPCGAGKTHMALEIVTRHMRAVWRRVLVVAPTLAALFQAARRLASEAAGQPTAITLFVGAKHLEQGEAALGEAIVLRHGTVKEWQAWARASEEEDDEPERSQDVALTLYSSAAVVRASGIEFDAVVLDEAHHAFSLSVAPIAPVPARLPHHRTLLYDWDVSVSASLPAHPDGIAARHRLLLSGSLQPAMLDATALVGTVLTLEHRAAHALGLTSQTHHVFVEAATPEAFACAVWARAPRPRAALVFCSSRQVARRVVEALGGAAAREGDAAAPPCKLLISGMPGDEYAEAADAVGRAWVVTCRCASEALDGRDMALLFTEPVQSARLLTQMLGRAERIPSAAPASANVFVRVPCALEDLTARDRRRYGPMLAHLEARSASGTGE